MNNKKLTSLFCNNQTTFCFFLNRFPTYCYLHITMWKKIY